MIKRVFLFVFILSIVSVVQLFAVGPKHYFDRDNGYSGYSEAIYIGISDEVNQDGIAMIKQETSRKFKFFMNCEKLNKEERYLLWSALKEFDLSDNEMYGISIVSDNSPELVLSLVIKIKENGKNFDWYNVGYFYMQ